MAQKKKKNKKISLTNSSSKEELFLNWLGLGQIGKMLRVSGSEVGDEKRGKKIYHAISHFGRDRYCYVFHCLIWHETAKLIRV